MASLNSLKKAELIALIESERQDLVRVARENEQLRTELSIARANFEVARSNRADGTLADGPQPEGFNRASYWDYVRARRQWHRARGDRSATYCQRTTFEARAA